MPTLPLRDSSAGADPPPLRRMFQGCRDGAAFFGVFLALIVAMVATGRVAIATYRRPLTESLWRWYPAAIWRDVAEALPYLAALAALPLVVIVAVDALPSSRRRTSAPRRALQAILVVVALVTWLSAISFCESLIQRGTLPVWHDFVGGMDDAFLTSALANFTYARYFVPGAVVWPLAVWAIVRFGRRMSQRPWRPWGFASGFGVAALAFSFLAHPIHAPRLPLPRVLLDTSGVNDPFGRFFRSVATALAGAPTEPRDILAGAELGGATKEGAAMLGLQLAPDDGGCKVHPWAAPFDDGEPLFRPLGQALFAAGGAPLHDLLVFHVSLESFRGDDLTALNPNAPRVLAPFMNELYEAADASGGKGPAVVAAKNMWQAGVRTSQGMSGFTCGFGALPHGISLVRDLGQVPLRCLPDVVVDAGFDGVFAYGSNPHFDNMQAFLRYHGFTRWLNEDTLPKGLPLGEWGAVSDRALVKQTLLHVGKASRPTFTLLMTLSNHSPFKPPQDVPPEVERRVKQALATQPNDAKAEDRPRLITYAYTDFAAAEFFAQLHESGLDRRSIVVVHADHSTGERYLWRRPDGENPMTDAAKGRIPFAVVLPAPLVERAADPAGVRAAAANVHRQLNTGPVSLNDIPLWVLGLLRDHPAVAGLPQAWQWHSMGGMTASRRFHVATVPAARLWGINGVNQLFFLDERGSGLTHLEHIMTLTNPAEIFTASRPLFPASALWSDFLRGYTRRCGDARNIRSRAP